MARFVPLVLVAALFSCEKRPGTDPLVPQQYPPPCLLLTPSVLDFGEVTNLQPEFRSFTFQNTTSTPLTVRVSGAPAPYSFTGFERVVGPGGIGGGTVSLVHDDALLHAGAIELDAGPECRTRIGLRALGKGRLRTEPALPAALNFGFVAPGERKTLEVTFLNPRRVPVSLFNFRLSGPIGFTHHAPERIELAAVSSAKIPITASPESDLAYDAVFVADTDEGLMQVQLFVVGGGPVAELSETALVIPIAGFSAPSFPPSFVSRQVRLRNVSTQGRSGFAALRVVQPQVRVESLGAGSADELQVLIPDSLAQEGLALGTEGAFELRLVPSSIGHRSYRVTLFTNDPVRPEQVMTVEADVQTLPECQLRVSPEAELTLTKGPNGVSSGEVFFVNTGSTPCWLDDLRLEEPLEAPFTLANAPPQVRLGPGETHVVTVSTPTSPFTASGWLGFHVFNANSDRQRLQIRSWP